MYNTVPTFIGFAQIPVYFFVTLKSSGLKYYTLCVVIGCAFIFQYYKISLILIPLSDERVPLFCSELGSNA